ncbi:response regulator transcription factor [Streptomyces griseoviridis]|uniref:response regulator transcription factor n=1 Tax=Streptomyces griseoviridis TaxID=45398 RepID=UPI003455A4A3
MPEPSTPPTGAPQPPPSPSPFDDFSPTVPAPPAAPLRVVVADDNPVVRAGLTALLSGRPDIVVVAEAADGREACEAARELRPDVVLLDVRMPGVDGISALPYLVRIAPVVMLTYSRESEIVRESLRRGAGGYLVHGEFTADQLITAVRDINHGGAHFTRTAAGALLAQVRQDADRGAGREGAGREGAGLPEGLGGAEASDGNLAQGSISSREQPASPAGEVGLPQELSAISPHLLSRLQSNVGQSSSAGWPGGRAAVPDRSRFPLSAREAEIMDLIASGMNNQQIAATCFISEKTVKNHINRIFAKLHSTSRSEAAAKWLGTAWDQG